MIHGRGGIRGKRPGINGENIGRLSASALALRAIKARALALHNAADRRGADFAGQAGAVVHLRVQLKIAQLTRGLHVIAQRAAAGCNRGSQHALNRADEPRARWSRQFACGGSGPNPRMKQRLRSVNIAHANHDMPIHNQLLGRNAALAGLGIEILGIEQIAQRLRSQPGQ